MERTKASWTAVRKEIALLGLALLVVVAVPQSTSRYQTLYEGILAVEGSLIVPRLPMYVHLLPPGSKMAILDYWKAVGAATDRNGRFQPPVLERILVRCTEGVPPEVTQDPDRFSRWVKEKCEFSPLWRP